MKEELKQAVEVAKGVNEVTGTFFDKLNEALVTVTAKLTEAAPEVVDGLLKLIQFKGGFLIAVSLIMGGVTIMLIMKSMKEFSLVQDTYKVAIDNNSVKESLKSVSTFKATVFAVISSIFGTITLVAFLPELLSFYNWLSLFFPEGAIAFKALEAMDINI